MKKKKKIILIFLVFFSTHFLITFVDVNAEIKNGLLTELGKTYYYINGEKQSGLQNIDGKTYFFSRINDHAMRIGEFNIDGVPYYFDDNGVAYNGILEKDGRKYYYINGEKQSGLQNIDGKIYFFSRVNDNAMRTGEFNIDGVPYGFNDDGVAYNGWIEKNKNKYYYENGKKSIGLTTIDNKIYYFNNDGIQLYGFQNINNNTYFFSRINDHAMRTGYFQIDDYFYFFDDAGIMQKGFQKIDDNIKFFSRVNGAMRTGWVNIDGNMYYFEENGNMITGTKQIGGIEYFFNDDGKLKDNFVKDSAGNTKYLLNNGSFAKGWITIAGTKYFFNDDGNMIAKNAKKIIDISNNNGDIDWEKVKNDGVDGVILRVASYSSHLDYRFVKNLNELKRLNIPYGLYLYSYSENQIGTVDDLGTMLEPELDAMRIAKAIKDYNVAPTYPIYIDYEQWDNSQTNHNWTADNYRPIINAFGNKMTSLGYGNWQIYTNKWLAENVLYEFKDRITWIAQFNNYGCTYNGNYNMWQYTSKGKINGINGNVDISILY